MNDVLQVISFKKLKKKKKKNAKKKISFYKKIEN